MNPVRNRNLRMKIKSGDTVKVISGQDRGKTGKVIRVLPKDRKIIIEGINVKKKHMKSRRRGQKGQMIKMAVPIDISNALIVCSRCGKATRVRQNKKVRVCKKCGSELE